MLGRHAAAPPPAHHRLLPGAFSGAPVLDDVYDTRAGLDVVDQEVEAYGGGLTIAYELNDTMTVKSITGYRKDHSTTPIDFDSLPQADLDVPAIYRNKQFSQELQFLYEGDRLSGVLGAYYLDANAFTAFDVALFTTGALPAVGRDVAADARDNRNARHRRRRCAR